MWLNLLVNLTVEYDTIGFPGIRGDRVVFIFLRDARVRAIVQIKYFFERTVTKGPYRVQTSKHLLKANVQRIVRGNCDIYSEVMPTATNTVIHNRPHPVVDLE